MPSRVASWPVVGIFLAPTFLFLRTWITALPRPSLASIVALISGCAVNCCWKIVPPTSFFQSVAIWSPTSVAPAELVLPGFSWATDSPQTTEL